MQSNSVGVTDFIKKLQHLIDLITLIMWEKELNSGMMKQTTKCYSFQLSQDFT